MRRRASRCACRSQRARRSSSRGRAPRTAPDPAEVGEGDVRGARFPAAASAREVVASVRTQRKGGARKTRPMRIRHATARTDRPLGREHFLQESRADAEHGLGAAPNQSRTPSPRRPRRDACRDREVAGSAHARPAYRPITTTHQREMKRSARHIKSVHRSLYVSLRAEAAQAERPRSRRRRRAGASCGCPESLVHLQPSNR